MSILINPYIFAASSTLLVDLVSWWELDEVSGNAIDSHASNDLTDNNTVGASGGWRDFERSNSEYFDHTDNTDLSTGDIDFSFTAWVNIESAATRQCIIGKDAITGREYILMFSDGTANRFQWVVFDNASSVIGNVTANNFGDASTGTPYFIHVWHDAGGNQVGISVNDGTPNTAATTGGASDNVEDFLIGARRYTGAEDYFDGLISRVGFWKRLLTSGEITFLYNGGSGQSYGSL